MKSAAALALAWLAGGAASAATLPDLDHSRALMVEQTNALRRAAGLAATPVNPTLAATAREFAEYMASHDRYGHSADGRVPAERVKAQGYAFCMISENIAYQYSSAGFDAEQLSSGFVTGWADSPPHRRNMLEPDVTETGIGVAWSPRGAGGVGAFYAVQLFGRPLGMRLRFSITNRSLRDVRYEVAGQSYRLPAQATRTIEQCTTQPLNVDLPADDGRQTVVPADGGRYRIERVDGQWRVVDR